MRVIKVFMKLTLWYLKERERGLRVKLNKRWIKDVNDGVFW
jgi:hypothetical protein